MFVRRTAMIAALALICATVVYGSSGRAASAALGSVPRAIDVAQFDAALPLFQTANWNVVEDGGWNAVWTFDNGRRTMTGVWINRSTGERVTVPRMRVQQNGRQIIITRPGLGNYVGTIGNGGASLSGTLSWSNGRFSASVGAAPQQNIGRIPLFEAPSWNVSEDGGWNAIWTFDPGRSTMSGQWTNAQTGQRARAYGMFVRQNGRQIIISRPGLGNYVGTISADGTAMSGTLSWSNGHFSAHIR